MGKAPAHIDSLARPVGSHIHSPKARNGWILLAAIGGLALNLRGPFVAVAPVVDFMRPDLGFSPVLLGLLTSIPVLCFSVAAPLASLSARRLGAELAVTLTIFGVLAGVLVRSAAGPVLVVAGTVLIGLAITVGNIAVPLIIRRDFTQERQGLAMGVYTGALNFGSFLTSITTAPLASLVGWRAALAIVGILSVAGLILWFAAVGAIRAFIPAPLEARQEQTRPTVRSYGWTTFGLSAGFSGQAFSYYAVTAWLPSYLNSEFGMPPSAAGAGSSIFQILAIVGGLGVPFASRRFKATTTAIVLGVLWTTVPVGLLVIPGLWWLWSGFGGIAQGGGITLIFIAVIKLAADQGSAARMSATVQGVGYCFAAVAPPLVGLVHDITNSWTPALLVVLASVVVFFVSTTLAVRRVRRGP